MGEIILPSILTECPSFVFAGYCIINCNALGYSVLCFLIAMLELAIIAAFFSPLPYLVDYYCLCPAALGGS